MIISTYYNKENDVVVISTTKKGLDHEVNGDLTLLKNDGKVVGINAFNQNLDLNPGLNDSKKLPTELTSLITDQVENPFEVGLIQSIEKHPKSDKLNICQVKLAKGVEQIVCGASNVTEGIKVVVAKVGAVMPNGMSIVPSKLIDVESNGMICSLRELGKPQTNAGIEILSDEYNVGEDYL